MAKTQRRNRKGAAPRKSAVAVKRRARAAGTRPAAKSRATARKAVKSRLAASKTKKPARSVAAKARSAKRAVKKTVARKATSARRMTRKVVGKASRKAVAVTKKATAAVRRVAKAAAPLPRKVAAAAKKAAARKKVVASAAKKLAAAPKKAAGVKAAPAVKKAAAPVAAGPVRKAPALDRERRTVGEPEMVPMPPSSLVPGSASAARSGADELRMKMATHTGVGAVLTAGDVDADWGAAEAVGDEAPGGDNPTPDQDVVDEIGRALGVEYDDDEELQGGDEIASRDRDRWELDPASSDDFDER
jgi:hypothetical protein